MAYVCKKKSEELISTILIQKGEGYRTRTLRSLLFCFWLLSKKIRKVGPPLMKIPGSAPVIKFCSYFHVLRIIIICLMFLKDKNKLLFI